MRAVSATVPSRVDAAESPVEVLPHSGAVGNPLMEAPTVRIAVVLAAAPAALASGAAVTRTPAAVSRVAPVMTRNGAVDAVTIADGTRFARSQLRACRSRASALASMPRASVERTRSAGRSRSTPRVAAARDAALTAPPRVAAATGPARMSSGSASSMKDSTGRSW
jgi:hypothetical protein